MNSEKTRKSKIKRGGKKRKVLVWLGQRAHFLEVAACLLPCGGRRLKRFYVNIHVDACRPTQSEHYSPSRLLSTARSLTQSGPAKTLLPSMGTPLKFRLATAASPISPVAACTCCLHGKHSLSVPKAAHSLSVCPFLLSPRMWIFDTFRRLLP